MWDRVVDIDSQAMTVGELLSLLECVLGKGELREFAEEIHAVIGDRNGVLEPCDYEVDA